MVALFVIVEGARVEKSGTPTPPLPTGCAARCYCRSIFTTSRGEADEQSGSVDSVGRGQ